MGRKALAVLCAVLLGSIITAAEPQFRDHDRDRDATDARLERERDKALNKERQESLKKDTEKLLKLATELKEQVDKTNENMLSLDVMKKTEEIEKLAKQVHEKMKGFALSPALRDTGPFSNHP
jgi:hypothetical protein